MNFHVFLGFLCGSDIVSAPDRLNTPVSPAPFLAFGIFSVIKPPFVGNVLSLSVFLHVPHRADVG